MMTLILLLTWGVLWLEPASAIILFHPPQPSIAKRDIVIDTVPIASQTSNFTGPAGVVVGGPTRYTAGQFLELKGFTSSVPPTSTAEPKSSGFTAVAYNTNPTGTETSDVTSTTSSTPEPSTSSSDTGGEQQDWVDAHNAARRQYGAKDLVWDGGLSQRAGDNAQQCTHEHSNSGENIAWMVPGTMSPLQVVDMWMSEEPNYTWDNPHYKSGTGHFTQVIWRSTRKVGCCIANCPDGGVQATCEYDPAGNYVESFAQNVFPSGTPVE